MFTLEKTSNEVKFHIICVSVVDPDSHRSGSAWIRNFCLDLELKFRIQIQQKVKEHINKTVNSGLIVLLDRSIE